MSWTLDPDADLVIDWRESGGPPVCAPTRRGFGTTIIQRSAPHDLNGQASVDYAPEGFQARFVVPARFAEPGIMAAQPLAPTTVRPTGFRLSGSVLLVEDSMIIPLDSEEKLLSLGAERVQVGNDVAEALRLLDLSPPAFALLDINLGREMSFPVADRLRERGVPFVFAFGYGDEADLPAAHRGGIVIKKPFTAEDFAEAAARAVERHVPA